MQDIERLREMRRRAHEAGDTDAAQRLTERIRAATGGQATPQQQAPRDRSQGMIPTDDPGNADGFVTQAQFDDERTRLTPIGEDRQRRVQRLRSDAGDLIQNPLGYAASRMAGTVERTMQQPVSDINPARAFAEAAPAGQLLEQGATLGYGDELMGGAAAAGAAVSGGNPGDAYRRNTDGARAELHANRDAAPATSMALEGAGGLAMMPVMPGGSFVARGTTRAGVAGRGAVLGSGYGAVVGSGEAEGGLANRAIGGVIGATVGAVTGAGAPLVIEGSVRAGRGALRVLARAFNSRTQGREFTRSQQRIWDTLLDEAEKGGVTEQVILTRYEELRAAGLSSEETTGEMLGSNAVERMRGGVGTGNSSAIQGRNDVNARQARTPARVRQSLQDGLGSDGSDFTPTRDSLRNPTPRETELYGEFQNQPGVRRDAPPVSALPPSRMTRAQLEQMNVDDLDRMAFGYVSGDELRVAPDDLRIRWPGDLENPANLHRTRGDAWVDSVDLTDPVDVSVRTDGNLYLEDGHHRYYAARQRGEQLNARVDIEGKPIGRILAAQDAERLNGFFQNRRFAGIARRAAQDINPSGAPIDVQNGEITPELFDAIKKRIDRMVNDATSGPVRDTTRARPLEQLQREFVDFADEVFPNYAPARAEAQVRLSQRQALDMGRDIFSARNTRTPEDVVTAVERMTPEQLQRFRQGVARGVSDQLDNARVQAIEVNNSNITADAVDAPNAIMALFKGKNVNVLRAAFGDEVAFERFVRRMMIERDRSAVFPRISPQTAGSPTSANQIAANVSQGTQAVADGVEVASGNWLGVALRRIQGFAKAGAPNPEMEREIQRILWSTADEQRPALLAALRARGLISQENAVALESARQASAPATNAFLQSTQN
jgi:hypothetical protein